MDHNTEDEPISVTETTYEVGGGSAAADHQEPSH